MTATLTLNRAEGRIAYDLVGEGPLVICAPGMGDIRQTFRYLVPALVAAGYRVATFDLRGHGDSDTTFTSYDDEAEASDILWARQQAFLRPPSAPNSSRRWSLSAHSYATRNSTR
jgi:pimeloyl-ACP methyl ester carboxylesterase